MAQAILKGEILAESNHCQELEGNCYFPPESLRRKYFRPSRTKSYCPWKGEAYYYNIVINGQTLQDAAWYYPSPKSDAQHIRRYVAFWGEMGVKLRPVKEG